MFVCVSPATIDAGRSTRTSASLPWRPCRRASACSRQTKEGTARRSSKARRDSCYLRRRMHSRGRFRSSTPRPFVRCEVPASRGRNPSTNPCFSRRCARSSPPPRPRCESARKGDIVKEGCRTSRPMAKSALVTGATGQDGSYLMELLLSKGYEVYGLVRRLSVPNTGNIQHILDRVTLIDGDLIDQSSLNAAVKEAAPDEIYSLAAQSFVATSFVQPVLTGEITGLGVVRLLEAVRANAPDARLYQASSSEMVGRVGREPQDGKTAFRLAGISNWEKHVTMDDKNLRPSEVYNLRGDASKAKRILGWEAKTRFKDLVRKMVEAEIRALEEARPAS